MRPERSFADVTTARRAPGYAPPAPPWAPVVEAPTHLSADPDDELPTGFARGSERGSERPSARDRRSTHGSIITATPKQPPVVAPQAPQVHVAPQAQVHAPPAPVAAPAAPAAPQALPPVVQTPDGISFDPLQVPLPPELAPSIYGWLRRLALQADLAGADRVLRDALGDLTSSLRVVIVYPGTDGLFSLGADDELPADKEPLVAVARARRAIVGSHLAIVPIATTTETIAVFALSRNQRQPAYGPAEQLAMAAIAREAAGVFHHLASQYLERAAERAADKGGLYRPEALESHRTRGQEGALAELSPRWVKITYPVLVAALATALVVGAVVHVPTYSSGIGFVVYEGARVTAPAPGTVDAILVEPGQEVRAGQVLVRLHSAQEEGALRQAKADLDATTATFLFDVQDENARKKLASAQASYERARSEVDARTVRARKAGVVSYIRVHVSQGLTLGDHILSIVDPGTQPEVIAFLPGTDRPRLRAGMDLQVALDGYTKGREAAKIKSVSKEAMGAQAVRAEIGPELADALKLDGSYVIVRATLPSRTFKTEHRTYRYYHGMPAKTEVRIESKRFLVTLLPMLEKYLD